MTYKDLLVNLDDSKGCRKRVDAAVRLARQHGAHLTGVYPIVEIPLLHYCSAGLPSTVRATTALTPLSLTRASAERVS